MEKITMKKLNSIFMIMSLLFFFQCANQQMPPGGPKDKTPPEIINIYPPDGTLNFNDDHFEIEFSEYIDKLSLLNALFISPEIKRIDYDWSGTSVEITFDDTLRENTTYTVSIGSEVKDLNNKNPMATAVNFTFSTGPEIDSGKIGGMVYGNDLSGTMVFAYLKADTFANPVTEKPINVTQVGKNGNYQLMGLKKGEYRIFAVKDENGNRLYNIGEEAYGVISEPVILNDSVTEISGINFKMTKEDTVAPFISNITMTDRYHFSVEYSEFLDPSEFFAQNFCLVDTLNNHKVKVKYYFQGNKKKFEYFLVIADTLPSNGNYVLIAKNIYDKFGNRNPYDKFEITLNEKPDTLFPKIKPIVTPYKENKIDYLNPYFTIVFSDAISSDSLNNSLILDKYDWEIKKVTDAKFIVKILSDIKPATEIDFKIDRSKITDAAGNKIDSLQSFKINTLTGRELTGLSGKVEFAENIQNMVVVINGCSSSGSEYRTKVKRDSSYSFERILPDKYTIWMFDDKNNNGKFDYGKISPFQFSEKFFTYPDTLLLRPRWPVGDVIIK
jgi:uncharacterized protein (DUF2141 family)